MANNPLLEIFNTLLSHYGPRHWWPGETRFEVCVGAILTQNTNWGNVEKAIASLKAADRLSVEGIAGLEQDQLAVLIRPAGYFNVKACRLHAFVRFLQEQHQSSLGQLFSSPWQDTRNRLLSVKGIGPETADSILLYAGNKPSFVVDTYTRRIFSRLKLIDEACRYDDLRQFFMGGLPHETSLFNEYHALIVELGKNVCRPKPRCHGCCLAGLCAAAMLPKTV